MDPEPQLNDEYTSPAAADEQEFTSHSGGMFAGSQNFVVAGGTFTNLTTNYVTAPALPTDLRMIPLGDIDLQQQLAVENDSGIIGRRRERHCVRRVYSAKLGGHHSKVTVAMYQGDRAEEKWREEIERYMAVRHPNIVQVCGGASHGSIHATVFYGDLVPFERYMARHSPIMTVYSYAYHAIEWDTVVAYLGQGFGTLWIRWSTGRLCVDPIHRDPIESFFKPGVSLSNRRGTSSRPVNQDTEAIQSLTIEQYHSVCFYSLSLSHLNDIPPTEVVTLGAVVRMDDHTYTEIACLVDAEVRWCPNASWPKDGKVLEDGWTRYQADNVFNTELSRYLTYLECSEARAWLSQAHHIFSCCQITSHLKDYALVDAVYFTLSISSPNTTPPPGYLFLCPLEAFETGPVTLKWPDCPAYWSLDPLGVEHLSTEEATRLGFPSMELQTQVFGESWDASVYAGLRQFHEAKGFDPDSQDVARHIGYPLYRVSGEMDPPFAHEEVPAEEEANVNYEESGAESGAAPTLNDPVDDEPTELGDIFRDHSDHDAEDAPVGSPWFNLVMHTKLALILFLLICGIYEGLY